MDYIDAKMDNVVESIADIRSDIVDLKQNIVKVKQDVVAVKQDAIDRENEQRHHITATLWSAIGVLAPLWAC